MAQPVKPWSRSNMAQVAQQQQAAEEKNKPFNVVHSLWLCFMYIQLSFSWDQMLPVSGWWERSSQKDRLKAGEGEVQHLHNSVPACQQKRQPIQAEVMDDFMENGIKKSIILLTELVEEEFGIKWAFAWFFHVQKEEKHGCSQRFWTG